MRKLDLMPWAKYGPMVLGLVDTDCRTYVWAGINRNFVPDFRNHLALNLKTGNFNETDQNST